MLPLCGPNPRLGIGDNPDLPLRPRSKRRNRRLRAQGRRDDGFVYEVRDSSDDAYVLRLFTLAAGSYVELHLLAFFERLVTVTLDIGEVNEHIVRAFS